MIDANSPLQPDDGRRETRTHLFVAATLYADSNSTPVHIRNISPSGALIEADKLPDVGEKVALKRGLLGATGWIAWRVARKAGVRLETCVHVGDWMPRPVNAEQERLDTMLSIIRGKETAPRRAPSPANAEASIEGELARLRVDLAALGASLVEDVILVATHPEIQMIDISLQRIDKILRRVRGGD